MAPSTYQGPRADIEEPSQLSMSQDARLAFEKAYSRTVVQDVLEQKGSEIFTITASMTLAAAVAELSARKIGNMPVIDQRGGLVGVLSERDVIAATAELGDMVLADPVSAHMTTNPQTCSSEDRVLEVMDRMTKGRFRHMPVVDGDALVGMISIRDMVIHRVQEVEYENLRLKQLMVG